MPLPLSKMKTDGFAVGRRNQDSRYPKQQFKQKQTAQVTHTQ